MFLHAGNNKIIREKDIIGIFDMDNSTVSHITRKYLAQAEREERLLAASDEIPKSFSLQRKWKNKGLHIADIDSIPCGKNRNGINRNSD